MADRRPLSPVPPSASGDPSASADRPTRRTARAVAAFGLAAGALVAATTVVGLSCAGPPVRPNVVVVVIDALRADSLSCLGATRRTTPNLDRLAARGVLFEQAIAVGGNTSTGMAGLISGRYPFFRDSDRWGPAVEFGMARFRGDGEPWGLPGALVRLPEVLQKAGYRTCAVVTNPYLTRVFNFDRGFDDFTEAFRWTADGELPARAADVTALGLQWLESTTGRPFFLYLHYMDVHTPYDPPAAFAERFDFPRVTGMSLSTLNERWEREDDLDDPRLHGIAEHMRGLCDAELAYTDHEIGRLLDHLERLQGRSTLVVVTADHGDEFLEHGGTTHKGTLYEEIVHVPLIVQGLGLGPRRVKALVRNFDVMPTILELCSVDGRPADLDAVSLVPLLRGRRSTLELEAFANFPADPPSGKPPNRMLRTEASKLLDHGADDTCELYDLSESPSETVDTAALRPAMVVELRERLARLRSKLAAEGGRGEGAPMLLDEATRDRLRALGYEGH